VPAIGRTFDASDVEPGAQPVTVVTDRFWRTRLGARSDVVGTSVRIDGVDHVIIGVLRERVAFPDFAEFWVPLSTRDTRTDEVQLLFRANGDGDGARAAAAIGTMLATDGQRARIDAPDIRPVGGALLIALLAAIGFVLLVACANVANLVLARGTTRRHELAVRSALGASRAALLCYLVAEGILIALASAIVGSIMSAWAGDLIVAAIPSDGLPIWFEMRIDGPVLGYIAALALATVVVSSMLPAFVLTRQGVALILAALGVWGVVAYAVSRRTREIGVRLTLGATEFRIVRDIATGTLPAVLIGLAVGLPGAIGLGFLLSGLLFGVEPIDPVALLAVLTTFLGVTLVSSWLPARRAARIDPLEALRRD
jgi:putative ABC transport system permease protein